MQELRACSKGKPATISPSASNSKAAAGDRSRARSIVGLAALIQATGQRYPMRYIAGHSDIAPGRKDDPGPLFDWRELRAVLHATGIERPF
jgi:AmpD protein